jgi:hypothetical protein
MPTSTKCQKIEKKMTINVIQHDDIYDCFTMEHFRLRQRMTLTIKIYCLRLYIKINECFYLFLVFSNNNSNWASLIATSNSCFLISN